MRLLSIFLSFFLITIASAIDEGELYGFEILEGKPIYENLLFLDKNHKNFHFQCDQTEIHNYPAYSIECFRQVEHFDFKNLSYSGPAALELEIFLPSDFKDQEFLFSYSSSLLTQLDTPRIISTRGLAKGIWTTMRIWLPHFQSNNQNREFGFGQIPWTYQYYQHCLNQKNPWASKNLIENERNGLLDTKRFHLNHTTEIFLRALRLRIPKKPPSEMEIDQRLRELYPSYFDHQAGILFLVFLFAITITAFLFQFKKKIGFVFLTGFLIPVLPLLSYLSFEARNFLRTFRDSKIDEIRIDLKSQFLEIEKLAREGENRYVNDLRKFASKTKKILEEKTWLPGGRSQDIADLLVQKKKIHNTPDGFPSKEVYVKSLELLCREIQMILPEETDIQKFFENKLWQARQINPKDAGVNERTGGAYHLEQADPLVIYRNWYKNKTGTSVTITNGKVYYDQGRGYGLGISDLFSIAATKLQLKELYGEETLSMKTVSEISSKLGLSLKSMDEYLNQPFKPMTFFTSGRRATFRYKRFWTKIKLDEQNEFILCTEANASSYLVGLPQKIQTSMEGFEKGGSTKYLFMGELVGAGGGATYFEDFILENQNDQILAKAAAAAKTREGKLFYGVMDGTTPYLILSGNFSPLPTYSLALKKDISKEFEKLQTNLNLMYLALISAYALLLYLSSVFSGLVTTPLHQLNLGLSRIQKGNLNQEVKVPGNDEFQELAQGFNSLLYYLRDKERITRFLSAGTADQIVSEGSSRREEVCVLFVGLLNIPEPDNTAQTWEDILRVTHQAINENEGIIDKFTGTACLGFFRSENITGSPLQAAVKIKETLSDLNQKREKTLKVGIGLATGSVVLGHVGSRDRKDFTCIGRTVNMAARLETLGISSQKEIAIYMDQGTVERNTRDRAYSFSELEPVRIKGIPELQRVYELLS